MVIINNFHAFPPEWQAGTGERGTSRQANNAKEFLQLARDNPEGVVVVNCNPRLTLEMGAAKLFGGLRKTPIVSVDLVLRAPRTSAQKVMLAVKKLFLRQVGLYIHYFRDYRAYAEVFGIPPDRHEFVPFKVNIRTDLPEQPEGEYVLCFGRSLRDYDTFLEAMEAVPYPGAISKPDMDGLRAHHARFTRPLDRLPTNVRVFERDEDDGSESAQIRILGNAKKPRGTPRAMTHS